MKNITIIAYTTEQAVEDRVLVDIRTLNPKWKEGMVSHITTNLLSRGYLREGTEEINLANLVDLLNQSLLIVRKKSNNFTVEADVLYTGKVELPSGRRQKILIGLNELGRYTLMLPEDW